MYNDAQREEAGYVYLAALFDGEGTIGLRPQGTGYYFRLRIEMTDYQTLSRVACIFGGSVRPGPKRNWRQPTWVWQTARRESVRRILVKIQPFARVKRPQVDLVLDCMCRRRDLIEMDRYFIELWKLKLKKPRNSSNQHGRCMLHINKLRKKYPNLF